MATHARRAASSLAIFWVLPTPTPFSALLTIGETVENVPSEI
jgi:hypothetical protein